MHAGKHSEETKEKIRKKLKLLYKEGKAGKGLIPFKKGHKSFRKGKKFIKQKECSNCNELYYPKRKEQIFCSNRCSAINKGGNPENMIPFKKGNTPWNKGKEWLEMRGNKHPNYTGRTPELVALRHSPKGVKWRNEIFKRDNWTCQECSKKGKIQAHHIIPISIDKSKAFDLDNGKTLCIECHKKTASYLNRWYKVEVVK